MKRQRGRNRGGGGGGKPQHNTNRAFESNGPDGVKARGNAQTVFEKYQQLARDAASGGDRVLAENYLQHAEHYFRTLRAMQPQRAPSDIIGRDQISSGLDIDFEAEPDESASDNTSQNEASDNDGEGQRDDRDERRDRQRDDRQRDDRPRDDRQRDDRSRDDRPRDDRPRDDRQQQGEGRAEGGGGRRRDRWRDREGRERFDRGDQPRDQPPAAEAQPVPATEPVKPSPVLRSATGDVSHAPAFLGRSAPEPRAEGEEAPAPKPRRTRKPKAPATADEG